MAFSEYRDKAEYPKCGFAFIHAIHAVQDKNLVVTPCCGWVGVGDPPKWFMDLQRSPDMVNGT